MHTKYVVKILSLFVVFATTLIATITFQDASAARVNFDTKEYDQTVRRLEYNPDDSAAGEHLRGLCRSAEVFDRCIASLNKLSKKYPNNRLLRYHAALAYVDKVPGLWPKSFRRLPRAISDLRECTKISLGLPAGLRKPYHTLAYIALGDALVKKGDVDEAIKIYQAGLETHESEKLEKRLAMDPKSLQSYVKEVRDRNRPVDTNISYLTDGGVDRL